MKRVVVFLILILVIISSVTLFKFMDTIQSFNETPEESDAKNGAIEIIDKRNQYIIEGDKEKIASLYDRSTKYGKWAYEHEIIKMRYINKWEEKQKVTFLGIEGDIVIRSVKDYNGGKRVNLLSCTKYTYQYEGSDIVDDFTVGTNHSMVIKKVNDKWVVSREWYKDPMADGLKLSIKDIEKANEIIIENTKSDYKSTDRRKAVTEYAEKFCGTASEDNNYRYNKKYRNYNYLGGDCANFASQILYEAGKFRQSGSWKYYRNAGSKAWVNADAFTKYMIYSGRASLISKGSYMKVLKASYKLMPGDFVAYEKKGVITHVSVVTGADSKGYAYVHSHNSDRSKVPFDIGFSGSGVKFWLVRVHL